MTYRRYNKRANGTWTRTTLAFEHYIQWLNQARIKPDHGIATLGPRVPRNYTVWPVFETGKGTRL